jgi:hypothetical protein
MLVAAFARRKIGFDTTVDEVDPLRQKWSERPVRQGLPWYAEEKAASGAFSSLIGLELQGDKAEAPGCKVWRAVALGDSCLIQIRNDQIEEAFPLSASVDFGRSPDLLSSRRSGIESRQERLVVTEGEWRMGDTFFMMTDALGCWFFEEAEADRAPWRVLLDLGTQEQPPFDDWIGRLRSRNAMKNDDVTLLRVTID